MSRPSDLVRDSKLHTEIRDSITIHSYPEIDETGTQFSRVERWKHERHLGRGGFGEVQLERCITRGTNQDLVRAVKQIKKPSRPSGSSDLARELEAIAKFSNARYRRWFVKSFGWYEASGSIFIAMEYCRHGDLRHLLQSRRNLPTEEARQITHRILEGLDQMHQNDFAHRDLKPGNVLIKSMPPEEKWWIVLADFGLSKRAHEDDEPTTAIKGTEAFMAPELRGFLSHSRPKSINEFQAADVWALGEITFQMLTGRNAFTDALELSSYCQGQREFPSSQLPASMADEDRNFVSVVMKALPRERMTVTQCLEHRWMKPLRVEEQIAALSMGQTGPVLAPPLRGVDASNRWSELSNSKSLPLLRARKEPKSMGPTYAYPNARHQSTSATTYSHNLTPAAADDATVSLFPPRMFFVLKQTLTAARRWDNLFLKSAGHTDTVRCVAFSPDGKWLASGSWDRTVKLWPRRTGAPVQTLHGHMGMVYAVAFSPDGNWLASGSWDETVRLWDTRTGALVQILEGHAHRVSTVAFSPDGKRLASGSWDATVRVWDVWTGALLQILQGHIDIIYSVAFSPDTKRPVLASGSRDTTIRLWDARTGAPVKTLQGHTDVVFGVAFSPDGKQLASGSWDNTVRLWDGRTGVPLTLQGHKDKVGPVAFSSDNKYPILASASEDKTIRLWDGRTGAPLQTLRGHTETIYSVAFSPESKRPELASGSRDKTMRLWSPSRGMM